MANGQTNKGAKSIPPDTNTVSNGTDTVSNDANTVSNGTDTVSNDANTVSNGTDTVSNDANKVSNGTDTVRKRKPFLDNIINTKNNDSMVYDVKNNMMYLYNKANAKYGEMILDADYMEVDMAKSQINAKGVYDTLKNEYTRTSFDEGGQKYDMDSMSYNLRSQKAKIRGVHFVEGEGIVHGKEIKKMPDNVLNIRGGKYTTCDAKHPHFYLALTKAQLKEGKNGKQIIIGPSYMVLEDVPLPLAIPFGFFPLMQDKNSGIIIPEFGEEGQKGFFLRDGGYYWAINDYVDLAVRGGIYTLGSWDTNITSSYKMLYKFDGSLDFTYANDIIGDKGSPDYQNMTNYSIRWSHRQDPKFLPNSTFAADVQLQSGSYNKFNGTIDDYIQTQTNSSISYSKTWAGTPFSLSANIQHSQNNRDSTVQMSLPNLSFNVAKIFPFQKRNAVGQKKWFEKISFTYAFDFKNTIKTTTTDFLTSKMLDDMQYGASHSIPISTSFSLFKYLNVSPSFTYKENWSFSKIEKEWSETENKQVVKDTVKGFNRVYDYNASVGISTIVYGMYSFNENSKVNAIRHVMTPSISGSYKPDFSAAKYGFYESIQTNANGDMGIYSPLQNGIYGGPSKGESASLSFSLSNNVEMKVKSKKDTSGYAKVKILESLNFSTSYNFLADEYALAPISISARTTIFKSLALNLTASLDPYLYDEKGLRTPKLAWGEGSIGRLTSVSFTTGYSLRSFFGESGEGSGTGLETLPREFTPEETNNMTMAGIDPNEARQLLLPEYYNFSVPWNVSFNYTLGYNKSGLESNITQTLSFNGNINLTPKWGATFSSGFDFEAMELTASSITITRDLHCWQMGFTWIPIGYRKSWSFNISVKSSVLQDLKLKKTSSYLDNLY